MNCLCNLFDNEIVWLILIALLIAAYCNSNSSCPGYSGYNGGCSCGCN